MSKGLVDDCKSMGMFINPQDLPGTLKDTYYAVASFEPPSIYASEEPIETQLTRASTQKVSLNSIRNESQSKGFWKGMNMDEGDQFEGILSSSMIVK